MADDREGVFELVQVAREVRVATRSLVHSGGPEQLAEGQQLLEQTRRALYLILAGELEAATSGPADETDLADSTDSISGTDGTDSTDVAPPEIG